MNPAEVLEAGAVIVSAVLTPHGFVRGLIEGGTSSGGSFAYCEFQRGDRRLVLHFRHSLGVVEYHADGVVLSHEDYMWSVLERRHASAYPGFSDDALDGFRHLAHDLSNWAGDFLNTGASNFQEHARRATHLKKLQSRIPE